jgi:hypothetical protein
MVAPPSYGIPVRAILTCASVDLPDPQIVCLPLTWRGTGMLNRQRSLQKMSFSNVESIAINALYSWHSICINYKLECRVIEPLATWLHAPDGRSGGSPSHRYSSGGVPVD